MSQFKTTSSISPSISAHIAQGEVVGVGVKGKRVGVLRGKKRDAKQKKLSFWAMCEVNGCLSKPHWHLTNKHQQEGEALEIARNQMSSSNSVSGSKEKLRWNYFWIKDGFLFPASHCKTQWISLSNCPTEKKRFSANILPSSSPNNRAATLRQSHFQMQKYLNSVHDKTHVFYAIQWWH